MPKATVVITTYNRAAMLRDRSLASVRKQTYTDWECIVVDDGSVDDTEAVVRAIAKEDPRIRYIKKENGGMSAARNLGARNALGEFIAFLDDDDEFLPTYLEKGLHAFETSPDEISCVAPLSIARDFYGRQTVSSYPLEPFWKYSIGSCCFFKRRIFFEKKIFFDETLKSFEDTDFYIQFHFAGEKLYRLWEPLVIVTVGTRRITGSSMTTNHGKQRECFDVFYAKDIHVYEAAGKDAVAWLCAFGGMLYLSDGKMAGGRKLLRRSLHARLALLPIIYIFVSWFGARIFSKFLVFKLEAMRVVRVNVLNRMT